MNQFWLPVKDKFFDCPEYRQFVVDQGCAIHNDECHGGVHPHHVIFQSRGVKSSDLHCIGLCFHHHVDVGGIHKMGTEKFAFKYSLDYERLWRKYTEAFLRTILHEGVTTSRKSKARSRGNNIKPLSKGCNRPEDFGRANA